MSLYTQAYIGIHFVFTGSMKSFGRTVLQIASTMPNVPSQSRSMYISWSGNPPITSDPPILKAKTSRPAGLDLIQFGDSVIQPNEFPAAMNWVDSQNTHSIGVARWLPIDRDDGYRHAAWLASCHTPIGGVEESPQTELYAVCLASSVAGLSPKDQLAWINVILSSIEASRPAWDYGYIEIGDWSDILEGGCYRTTMGDAIRWRQLLEYKVWQAHGMLPSNYKVWQDRYPVKGVYWGNYFGPRVLERIGGADRLKSHIDERCREDSRNGWYRDMPGGALFLALSDRISDAQYELGGHPPMRAMANAVWLWSVLREANVMI